MFDPEEEQIACKNHEDVAEDETSERHPQI